MVVFRFKSTGTAVLASAYAEVGNDSAGGLGLSTAAQGYLTRGVASGAGNRLNAGEGLAIAIYNQDASRPFKELYCRAFFSNSTVKVDMLEILAEVYYETGLSQSSGQAFVAV
jgi:hypothetical protein